MKTTVDALKDYYVEIGGTAADVENITTIPDMIDAIADKGISSLPEVTAEDNGDVLTVVNGVWSKAPSTNQVVVFAATVPDGNYDNMITLSDGVKNSDLDAALEAGKIVFIDAVVTGTSNRLIFTSAGRDTATNNRNFEVVSFGMSDLSNVYIYRAYYGNSDLNHNYLVVNKRKLAFGT